MQHFTDKEIIEIRENLNKGVCYCGICNGYGEGLIYERRNFIKYSHYGSSAIKNNDEQLRWLLETIFEECDTITPAVWSDYHMNYVPYTPLYKGIDFNRKHSKCL